MYKITKQEYALVIIRHVYNEFELDNMDIDVIIKRLTSHNNLKMLNLAYNLITSIEDMKERKFYFYTLIV